MHCMLQEARLFASISNLHIVRYHHSWIEVDEYSIENARTEESELTLEDSVELESPFIEFDGSIKEELSEKGEVRKNLDRVTKISLYIQMELCKETLEDYINRRSFPLTKEDLKKSFDIAKQLIEAIKVVHFNYSIIHRDLSLRNVFIAKDNKVKIGDFGLATKRHNIIPLLSSPLPCKPTITFDEPDFFSLEDDVSIGSAGELTHGLGTKTFAAPEQMSNLPYDQKADIYSLGLIFFALFYPTQTLSERHEILNNCREQRLPKEFLIEYPELSALITQMVNIDPSVRPTAEELLKTNVFGASNDWSKLNVSEKMCKVKLETADKSKERFIKIIGDTLLLYKNRNTKAKLCYSLNQSSVTIYRANSKSFKRINSSYNLNEELKSFSKIVIEHPQLETIEITI